MAKRLNKKVGLTPPKRTRIGEGEIGVHSAPARSDSDGVSLGDMPGLYASIGEHAGNVKAVASTMMADVCVDISDKPDIQRHLAIMLLEDARARGSTNDLTFSEEKERTYAPSSGTSSEQTDFKADLESDLRGVGLDSIEEALTTAPLTTHLLVVKNLPQQLCGSDYTMVQDRLSEVYAVGDLGEASARASEEETSTGGGEETHPLSKWIVIWSILMVFAIEFGLLLIMKQVVGWFSRWPLKPLYRFLRSLVRRLLRELSSIVFRVVLGKDRDTTDKFRELQLQQVLLFAGGTNPLVTIGETFGLV